MSQWFENDEFWEHFAPVMFDEKRWAGSRWEVENVLKLAGINTVSPVLDSCCGVGRHAVEFAALGHRVTAIDRTATYIDAARDLSDAENLDIDFILGDVRSFIRPACYRLAVNLFTSFGFFDNPDDERAYVRNIRESLSEGGCFVIDVNGKELLARDFISSEAWEKDGSILYAEYTIEDSWQSLKNRWMIINENGKRYEYTFTHRVYSAAELSRLLTDCGFSSVEVYGSFDGKPYNNNADRLIACATK
ncbi:MAG: class I SAM-dependent methyltransferase [Spirochaetales bacterium]|nr:class I SAM-dependent methyltransferase [Spirochaetales bacterium]